MHCLHIHCHQLWRLPEADHHAHIFVRKFYIPPRTGDGWLVAYSATLASELRSSTLATFVGWRAMIPRYSGAVVALGYWHT
jgi:hypothetical protein